MSNGALDAAFTPARQGVWATFDVPEDRKLLLVARDADGLRIIHRSETAADKAALATGDGSYRIHSQGTGLIVASLASDWPDLSQIFVDSSASDAPLQTLSRRLSLELEADVMSWGH